MANEKQFRVMDPPKGCPGQIPWWIVAQHEPQALKNHDQTLERLNQRGGASADEIMAILENRRWHRMDPQEAGDQLAKFVLDTVAAAAVAIAAATQPKPTELQQLLAMFDRAEVLYTLYTDPKGEGRTLVTCESGAGPKNMGELGFFMGLEFGADGALLKAGAWE